MPIPSFLSAGASIKVLPRFFQHIPLEAERTGRHAPTTLIRPLIQLHHVYVYDHNNYYYFTSAGVLGFWGSRFS